MKLITHKDIVSVYSGLAGRCCCGCVGKHSYASAHSEWAGKNRGYAVNGDAINDRSVKIISNKVLKNPNVEHEDDHSHVEIGNRLLIVYYKKA